MIDVSGGARSIVQVLVAGVASTLPAVSIARTENVWDPLPSSVNDAGDVQAAKEAESSLHSNVADPSPDVKENEAAPLFTTEGGCAVSVVSGAAVSIDHANVAGEGSTFPAASTARTDSVCGPSASVNVAGELHDANAPASI